MNENPVRGGSADAARSPLVRSPAGSSLTCAASLSHRVTRCRTMARQTPVRHPVRRGRRARSRRPTITEAHRRRVVVTGGAGLVGQNLAILLDSRPDLEQVYIDKDPKRVALLHSLHPGVTAVLGDLAEPGRGRNSCEPGTRSSCSTPT